MLPHDELDSLPQELHKAVYIFDSDDNDGQPDRPSKRRRVGKKDALPREAGGAGASPFISLMGGAETSTWTDLRESAYQECWGRIERRVETILRETNQTTLDAVTTFIDEASAQCSVGSSAAGREHSQVPCALIITGPNIASQDLLFEQLGDQLLSNSNDKFVRIRSSDGSNLKAILRKIIREVTAEGANADEEDGQLTVGKSAHKYLNYDLEAIEAHIALQQNCTNVFIALQDSEGFDSSLLSDLIQLLHSWRSQIPFTLLVGVATSVDLLQARLAKSIRPLLYASQFDVVQSTTILEDVFRGAVAGLDAPLRIGPGLLQSLFTRQLEQMVGIQGFISSIKYAYMCHFFANPLSVFISSNLESAQPEHLECIRSLPSFRARVEAAMNSGRLDEAKSLLQDDTFLIKAIEESIEQRRSWELQFLRSVHTISSIAPELGEYSRLYTEILADSGNSLESEDSPIIETVRKLSPEDFVSVISKLQSTIATGDPKVGLEPWSSDPIVREDKLGDLFDKATSLLARSKETGHTLRTKYSGQTKVVRTTVVAQKVQLSRDSATLTEADKEFTSIVDHVLEVLTRLTSCMSPTALLCHEIWFYDLRAPYREVFIPKPRTVFERSLTRPHDYLACSCCNGGDGGGVASPNSPAATILYHLYLDAGSLINVADLWSAFHAIVSEGSRDNDRDQDVGKGRGKARGKNTINDDESNEREILVRFYQGLAELRLLGFVKPSKKKADHIAKVKWL